MNTRPGTDQGRRYLATAIDGERAASRVLAVVGPLAEISEKHICAVLAEASESTPATRIGLDPQTDSPLWDYRCRDWRQAITRRPDLDTTNLGHLLTQIHTRPGLRGALEVLICGDYLVVDYSHALGDGRMGAMLLALLGNDDGARPGSLARRLPRWAAWTALLRLFALHPSKAGEVLRLRKSNKQALPDAGDRRITDWESARCGVTAYMEPRTFAELRSWSSYYFPGTTAAALTVSLLAEALRAQGVEVDEQVTILVDCRRYFAPHDRDCHGNFAVGIPISVPPGTSPSDVRRQMRQAIDSGRPFARWGVAAAKARLARPTTPASSYQIDVPDRVRLTVSDLGRLTMLEDLRWRADAQPPGVTAYVETDGPDAVDVEVTELLGARMFTASFCSKMIEPSAIEAALKHMCDDPLGIVLPTTH